MSRKTGVLLSYALMIVQMMSTMLFTPFLISRLGQAEYGVYSLMLSLTTSFTLLDLGVGTSVVRYMSKYISSKNNLESRKLLGVTTLYYFGISIIALVIGIIIRAAIPTLFATGLNESQVKLAQDLFFVTIISTSITLATSSFTNTIIAFEKFTISKGISIVMTVLKMVLSLLALLSGCNSMGIVLVNLVTTILTSAIYVLYVLFKLKVKPLFKDIHLPFIKEIVSYSSFILVQTAASLIITMSGQVLLGAFAKESAVIIGVFSVGTQIVQYFKSFGSHFTSVLMPGLVRFADSNKNRELYEKELIRISRIIFMFLSLVWVVFLFNGKRFVILWAGEENSRAFYVAAILMFPLLFSYSEGAGYQLIQALALHKLPSIVQLISAIITVPITILLILWKPFEGVVIGSFIAFMLCETVVMNIMYKKQLGIRLLVLFKGIFKGVLPSLIICVLSGCIINALNILKNGWLSFIINCTVMIITYGVCMLTFGMNKSEKLMIKGIIYKVLAVLKIKLPKSKV